MPSVAVNAGFYLGLEGIGRFAGLNINGSALVTVAPTGDLAISSSFSPGAGAIENAGRMHIAGQLNLNSGVVLGNLGTLTVDQGGNLNGPFTNRGTATFGGTVNINGSGVLHNNCVMSVNGGLSNGGSGSSNEGLVTMTGGFSNNGTWSQSLAGTIAAATLSDDGAVTGFGQYDFSGNTSVQGRFTGDDPNGPIVVDTTAPPGQIFDVESGVISNVVRGTVQAFSLARYPAPDCEPPRPSADVVVGKTGPATVTQNSTATYTVSVTNSGPGTADDVVVTDSIPAGFTGLTASDSGVVTATSVTWQAGTIAAAETATFTVTGTVVAAVGTTISDAASSASSSPDPNPENNDGSTEASQVHTLVDPTPPVNTPPVPTDQTLQGTTGQTILGEATATDVDADPVQKLAFTKATEPQHGQLELSPGGGFNYVSASDFTGVDSANFEVCDNGTPVMCATGTLTFEVSPRANDTTAETFVNQAVDIPLANNISDGAVLSASAMSGPGNGSVIIDPTSSTATYTPADGFTGTDTFDYQACSPTAAALCARATVTITVLKLNTAPLISDGHIVTHTDVPGSVQLSVSDPNGDSVTSEIGAKPASGTAAVTPTHVAVHSPDTGFAGVDEFSVIACDNGAPQLCSTSLVTTDVLPLALADSAETTAETEVTVPVLANDKGTVDPPTIITPPGNGSVMVVGTAIHYLPDAGFAGVDTFEYSICAADAPDLCATAQVTVTVAASTFPPTEPGSGPGSGTESGSSLPITGVDILAPVALALLPLGAGAGFLLLRRRHPLPPAGHKRHRG
jgi:uncharacterized repeat protein (TIGR01451 family)